MKIFAKRILILIIGIGLLCMLLFYPKTAKDSAVKGMLLCGNVIIPTLFPFMVISLFLAKTEILHRIPFFKKIKPFKLPIIIYILSCLGGYPIGAKLISEEYQNGALSQSNAKKLLFCCINAGPSFIILTIGSGILNSEKLGLILFLSHITASLIMFLLVLKDLNCVDMKQRKTSKSFIDSFVDAVSDASSAILNICGYIIFISTLLGILENIAIPQEIKNILGLTLEISNAITKTNNIYVLSAITAFGGLSIIFQVLHISRKFSPKIKNLIFSRIVHSLLSLSLTLLLIKTFGIYVETLSNIKGGDIIFQSNNLIISVFLSITVIAFIYSLASKKYCGKILKDIL